MRIATPSNKTAAGAVTANAAFLTLFLLGMDGVNDVKCSIHNGTADTDPVVIPQNTYDAQAFGLNGVALTVRIPCPDGIYFDVDSGSNYEAVIGYEEYP